MESVLERAKGKKPLKWKRLVLLGILAAAAVLAVLLLRQGGPRASASAAYTEAPVERRTITSALTGSGTLLPANAYTVTTLAEGDILSAAFEEGDLVEKDTVFSGPW